MSASPAADVVVVEGRKYKVGVAVVGAISSFSAVVLGGRIVVVEQQHAGHPQLSPS